jgi:UDP-2-acetamido-3-amino-2,3-dideoxy-glucuronate N-acetyltransferase
MPVVNSRIHPTAKIWHEELVNIYDSTIGENTKVASFVEIGDSVIGRNCKIEAFAFIPPGSVIEDNVFIGPNVTLTNDRYPSAKPKPWSREPVTVKRGASIGANCVVCPGVVIGENALIGAGSVISKDVLPCQVMHGKHAEFARVLIEE